MKPIFYILTIYPLRFAFLVFDSMFKVLPISALMLLSPFKVTRKNLSIAFPNLKNPELDLLAKESYRETIKSIYETLYTWSRPHKKLFISPKELIIDFYLIRQTKRMA